MVACLEELHDAFQHVPQAEVYDVTAATEHEVRDINPGQLAQAGVDADYDEDSESYGYSNRRTGAEMEPSDRVLLPCSDPVPHYNRGRTYIEPRPAA